jgi:hypothetical protein
VLNRLPSAISKNAEKFLHKLGSNPDPLFTIVALCLFNMTLRPLITLSDQNQPKERKLYAALREFVTELIALPVCVIMSRLAGGMLAKRFAKPENIEAVKNVFSFAGLLLANFTIPILGTLALDPLMGKAKKLLNAEEKPDMKPTQKLNIVSETPVIPVKQAPSSIIEQSIPSKNIWNYYNFEHSQRMKVN